MARRCRDARFQTTEMLQLPPRHMAGAHGRRMLMSDWETDHRVKSPCGENTRASYQPRLLSCACFLLPSIVFALRLRLPTFRNSDQALGHMAGNSRLPLLRCAPSFLPREKFCIFFPRRLAPNRAYTRCHRRRYLLLNFCSRN